MQKKFIVLLSILSKLTCTAYSSNIEELKNSTSSKILTVSINSNDTTKTELDDLSSFNIKNHLINYIKNDGYRTDKSQKEIENIFKSALLKTNKLDQSKDYQLLAEYGYIRAMTFLGNTLRSNNQFQEALKWYILAFQNEWLEKGIYSQNSIAALTSMKQSNHLDDQTTIYINDFLSKYLNLYPQPNINNKISSRRLNSCQFVENYTGKASDYGLTADEYLLKRGAFLRFMSKVFSEQQLDIKLSLVYRITEHSIALNLENLIKNKLIPTKFYIKVKEGYETSGLQESWNALGLMHYQNLFNEDLLHYDKAYDCLLKADTSDAHTVIAIMLMSKRICPELSDIKRCQQAEKHILKSNSSAARVYWGQMHYSNRIEPKIADDKRFQIAKEICETEKTSTACFLLGNMYIGNFIGQELTLEKRLELAEFYYKQSNEKIAYFNLALLYLNQADKKPEDRIDKLTKAANLFSIAFLKGYERAGVGMKVTNKVLANLNEPDDNTIIKKSDSTKEFGDKLATQSDSTDSSINGQDDLTTNTMKSFSVLETSNSNNNAILVKENFRQEPVQQNNIHVKDIEYQVKPQPGLSTTSNNQPNKSIKIPILSQSINKFSQDNNKVLADKQLADKKIKKIEKSKIRLEEYIKKTTKFAKQEHKFGQELFPEQTQPQFKIVFSDNKVKAVFDKFKQTVYGEKLDIFIKDIFLNPWSLHGAGRPKFLKGELKGYCSRRINKKIRLVYKVELGKIIIHDCVDYHH